MTGSDPPFGKGGSGSTPCHPEQAFFARREPALSRSRKESANCAKRRVLCHVNNRAVGSLP